VSHEVGKAGLEPEPHVDAQEAETNVFRSGPLPPAYQRFVGAPYQGPVFVDGVHFIECRFNKCELVYSGGNIPSFIGCEFIECGFAFSASASNTVNYMKVIHRYMGEWGKRSVETAVKDILADKQGV
jgi:hypothetical protein